MNFSEKVTLYLQSYWV